MEVEGNCWLTTEDKEHQRPGVVLVGVHGTDSMGGCHFPCQEPHPTHKSINSSAGHLRPNNQLSRNSPAHQGRLLKVFLSS